MPICIGFRSNGDKIYITTWDQEPAEIGGTYNFAFSYPSNALTIELHNPTTIQYFTYPSNTLTIELHNPG